MEEGQANQITKRRPNVLSIHDHNGPKEGLLAESKKCCKYACVNYRSVCVLTDQCCSRNTAKPRLTATSVIRSPCYCGHFF